MQEVLRERRVRMAFNHYVSIDLFMSFYGFRGRRVRFYDETRVLAISRTVSTPLCPFVFQA